MKTLAIRATAEENMVNRRDVLRVSQQKIPKLIEEAGMRHYIAVRLEFIATFKHHFNALGSHRIQNLSTTQPSAIRLLKYLY